MGWARAHLLRLERTISWKDVYGFRYVRIGSVIYSSADLVKDSLSPFSGTGVEPRASHMYAVPSALGKLSSLAVEVPRYFLTRCPRDTSASEPAPQCSWVFASLIPLCTMLLHITDLSGFKVFPTCACNLALQRPRQNCKFHAHIGCSMRPGLKTKYLKIT